MIVADTDVLIDFLGGREPAAGRVALELASGGLRTTVVTRFELLSGANTDKQNVAVTQLLEAIPPLSLDAAAADQAAEVRRSVDRTGQPIGMGDCLIAGIVLSNDAMLLTRNRRHFERVEGISLATLG